MSYTETSDDDIVCLAEFPALTMIWLAFFVSLGSALLFLAFHLLAWVMEWPGPFLWFGSSSRLGDIVLGTVGTAVSIFLFSAPGILVVKGLASIVSVFNVKVRIR